ncbi:Fur family zinc uptake transcriptional regulator [Sphingobium sp. OAS761]|uniref:Fur family transcriptional regulator n=1 Tax=Sphingobium sp. OAS761 TaxID=2817901 RepID=UPI00209DBB66|nr:transcriptional repressor [Sphingobium sp. OAS761]MCP1471244.1 Fur family zinc uptake transcriptional regulator [Sphingobium sp. OAS761]
MTMSVSAYPREKRNPADIDALVLASLQASATALSAYQIADLLSASGHKFTATQAYRTLARLISRDKVRRVETLSAYAAMDEVCDVMMICKSCGALQSMAEPTLKRQIENFANAHHFAMDRVALELVGNCLQCRSED